MLYFFKHNNFPCLLHRPSSNYELVDGEIILHRLLMFSLAGACVQYAIEGAYSLIASIAGAGHESDQSISSSQIVAH